MDDPAFKMLAADIGGAVINWLGRVGAEVDDAARSRVANEAVTLALIAASPPGPGAPFTEIGTRRGRQELQRLRRKPDSVSGLHAGPIRALATIGVMRGDIQRLSIPERNAVVDVAIEKIAEPNSIQQKPTNLHARAFARAIACLYEGLRDKKANRAENADDSFIGLLDAIAPFVPGVELGYTEKLARLMLEEERLKTKG